MFCDTFWDTQYGWVRFIERVYDCAGTPVYGVTKVVDGDNVTWYHSKTPFKFRKLGMKNERGLANVILSNPYVFTKDQILWANVIRIANYC